MIILVELAEPERNRRAGNIRNRISKQLNHVQLAETFMPITKKLTEVIDSTQKNNRST